LEWLRDKEQLCRFLEACLRRWEEVGDLKGDQQDMMMHNICETRVALDENDNNVITSKQKILWQVAEYIPEAELSQSGVNRLRQRSSRSIQKAKAYFKHQNPVTSCVVASA
jgi:hypothetical protein